MKSSTIALIVMAFTSGFAMADQADDYSYLDYRDALAKANAEWHKGTMRAQVFHNHIVAKFPDNSETTISTENKHLLSIAPYITTNHPCGYHVPTSCTGELKNTQMRVKIVDTTSNRTLRDEMVTTGPNGFVDFWMPSDQKGLQFTFFYIGKTVTRVLSTDNAAQTCITTMQLS